jgi:GWxTD domain-containing protein
MIRRTHADSVHQGRVPAGTAAVLDVFPVTLPPGVHLLALTVRDTVSGREGTCRQTFAAPAFAPERLSLSDLQVGTSISDAEGKGRFVKNRKLVMPNVTRSISASSPSLFLYFEIYNLSPGKSGGSETFRVTYAVLDSADHEVRRFPVRNVAKPGLSCAKAEVLDLSGLAPGDYTLRVRVSEGPNDPGAEGRRSFHLLPVPSPMPLLSLDEDALHRYFDGMKYLATQKELDLYRSLDPEGKRRFVLGFWKQRDPTPGTQENEFAGEHFRRMGYADKHLRQGQMKGSDTDRGRVYILYGPPSDIAKRTQPTDGKSYEVWTYETGGYYEFVFLDRRGVGDFELIHSTMPGEKYNPTWQEEAGFMLR